MNPRAKFIIDGVFSGARAFNEANRSMRTLTRESAVSARAMNGFGRMTTKAMSGVMRFFSRQVGNVFRSFFFGLRIWAIMGGAAISGFAVNAIKSFRDFDKKLRESTALIAGSIAAGGGAGSMAARLKKARKDSQKEYLAYRRDILAMSVGLRQSPTDLTGGLKEVISAGYTGRGPRARSAAMNILSAGAMGATAGGGDVQTSTRALIQIMNALGLKGKKIGSAGAGAPLGGNLSPERIIDRMFAAVNYGVNVTYSDLAASLSNVIGPIGTALNPTGKKSRGQMGLNQILGGIVIGSQKGLTASKSSIGMNMMLDKLLNPTKAAEKEYQALGLTPGAPLISGGIFGPGSAMDKITKAMKAHKVAAKDAAAALNVLFHDQRGYRMATTLFNTSLKDQAGVLGLIERSVKATKAAFDEQGNSLDGMIKQFQTLFDTFKIGLGISLMPYVKGMLNTGTSIINQITGGQKGMKANSRYYGGGFSKYMSPSEYAQTLQPGQAKAFNQYRAFSSMNGGAIVQSAFGAISGALSGWWDNGGRQTFLDLVSSIIDLTFKSLGKALDSSPGVYSFAVKMGAQIATGMLHQLKKSWNGTGGVSGFLSGGPSKLFTGGNLSETLTAGAIGLTAFTGLAGRFSGGGLRNRAQMGALMGGAGALSGADMQTSALLGMLGLMLPQGMFGKGGGIRAMGKQYAGGIGGAAKGLFSRMFFPPAAPEAAAAVKKAIGGAAASDIISQMIVNANTVIVNGRIGGGGARQRAMNPQAQIGAGHQPLLLGPGVMPMSPYPMPPIGGRLDALGVVRGGPTPQLTQGADGVYRVHGQPIYRDANGFPISGTPAGRGPVVATQTDGMLMIGGGAGPKPPVGGGAQMRLDEQAMLKGNRFQRLRYGIGKGLKFGKTYGGPLAMAAANIAMGLAGGGGTGQKVGSIAGATLPMALLALGPEMAPVAMALSGVGGMLGGMAGGGYDSWQQGKASDAAKGRLKNYMGMLRNNQFGGNRSQATYAFAQAVTGQKIGYTTDMSGKIIGRDKLTLDGIIGTNGVATVKAVNNLQPLLNKLAHVRGTKGLAAVHDQLNTVLTAINSPQVSAAVAAVYQGEANRITVELANKQIARSNRKAMREYKKTRSKMEGRDPYLASIKGAGKHIKGLQIPQAMQLEVTEETLQKAAHSGKAVGKHYSQSLVGTVQHALNAGTAAGFTKLATTDSAAYNAAIMAGKTLGGVFSNSLSGATTFGVPKFPQGSPYTGGQTVYVTINTNGMSPDQIAQALKDKLKSVQGNGGAAEPVKGPG
jgi:hypothetical protein